MSRANISKSKKYFNVKSSTYYFHMKTKILADFQICISVPLTGLKITVGHRTMSDQNQKLSDQMKNIPDIQFDGKSWRQN